MENSDEYEFIGLRNDEEKEKEIYIRHKTCNAQGMCQPQALAFYQFDTIHNGNKVDKWFSGQRKERNKWKLNPVYEQILLEYNPEFFKRLYKRIRN